MYEIVDTTVSEGEQLDELDELDDDSDTLTLIRVSRFKRGVELSIRCSKLAATKMGAYDDAVVMLASAGMVW